MSSARQPKMLRAPVFRLLSVERVGNLEPRIAHSSGAKSKACPERSRRGLRFLFQPLAHNLALWAHNGSGSGVSHEDLLCNYGVFRLFFHVPPPPPPPPHPLVIEKCFGNNEILSQSFTSRTRPAGCPRARFSAGEKQPDQSLRPPFLLQQKSPPGPLSCFGRQGGIANVYPTESPFATATSRRMLGFNRWNAHAVSAPRPLFQRNLNQWNDSEHR